MPFELPAEGEEEEGSDGRDPRCLSGFLGFRVRALRALGFRAGVRDSGSRVLFFMA